jgi:ribosomal protein L12E/L44/L45/RPP1/RPP2
VLGRDEAHAEAAALAERALEEALRGGGEGRVAAAPAAAALVEAVGDGARGVGADAAAEEAALGGVLREEAQEDVLGRDLRGGGREVS